MRPWTEAVYGIPPEQVIGSSIKTKFEMRDGVPVLGRLPELNFIDDKEGKPIAINQHIGRRPVAAFGNSDGDLQMLQWTAAGKGRRFALFEDLFDSQRGPQVMVVTFIALLELSREVAEAVAAAAAS